MDLLRFIPAVRELRAEKAELTERLAAQASLRHQAEEISGKQAEIATLWRQQAEKLADDLVTERAAHQQHLLDSTDAITRRFLMQNMYSKAPVTVSAGVPAQPLNQPDHRPAREAVKREAAAFVDDLNKYLADRKQ